MSERPDLAAQLARQKEQREADRKAGKKPLAVRDAFASSSDLMTRTNIYVPTEWLDRLKQRALDEKTSVSKLIVEGGERLLKEPARKPTPKRKWDRPDYDLS